MTVRVGPRSSTIRSLPVLTDGRGLKSLSDWSAGGILSHAAGPTDNGFRVVDVWESEEAFQRFGGTIGPVLQEVGFPGEPQIFPLHTSSSRNWAHSRPAQTNRRPDQLSSAKALAAAAAPSRAASM